MKRDEPAARDINREGLEAKIARGDNFVLADALSQEHYASSLLPGAVNLPYELVDEAGSVLPDGGAEVVVYCSNPDCEASALEARELVGMGCENVRHHAEGKLDWMRAAPPSRAGRESSHPGGARYHRADNARKRRPQAREK